MPLRRPDPDRLVAGAPLTTVMKRLAKRVADESGGSELRALADMKAAVERAIDVMVVLDRTVHDQEIRSWRQIGQDLGVSAQAAHRKYGGK